jgi:hypothetical protein
MLSSYLRLVLPSGLFPAGFSVKSLNNNNNNNVSNQSGAEGPA